MLKRLRIKFIALIMAMVALVMTGAFAAICYMDWYQNITEANVALDDALMKASVPHLFEGGDGLPSIMPGTKKGGPGEGGRPVPNAHIGVYQVEGDKLELLPDSSSGMMNLAILHNNQQELASCADGTGMIESSQLYYMKRTTENGTLVAVMYSGTVEHWKELACMLAAAGLAALAVLFLISIAFSRWALRPVQRAWDQQHRFVSDASHDLKTPIAVIQANTSILLDEPDLSAEERRTWLEGIQYEAHGMRDMVEDLLSSASDEDATQHKQEGVRCDFSRIVEKECLQMGAVTLERNLSVKESIAGGLQVAADEGEMKRVVQVILENACKYADEGGCVSVSLTPGKDGSQAFFAVSNTGAGIAEEELPHVFDRLYRGDAARTSHEGHGLGLAIARRIVDAAHGTIGVESEKGLTTFTVTIPLSTSPQ